MTEKICCFCGQTGHLAKDCKLRPRLPLFGGTLEFGIACAEVAVANMRARLAHKLDSYVPADVASSRAWAAAERLVNSIAESEKTRPSGMISATSPSLEIATGETERLGRRCADGGTCHHECDQQEPARCFRRAYCEPLSAARVHAACWRYGKCTEAVQCERGACVRERGARARQAEETAPAVFDPRPHASGGLVPAQVHDDEPDLATLHAEVAPRLTFQQALGFPDRGSREQQRAFLLEYWRDFKAQGVL